MSARRQLEDLTLVLVAVGLGASIFWMLMQRESMGGLAVGDPAPPLVAEEWLNGPPPPSSELKGKVVVVHVWASWCGPCRRKAPELVRSYEKFKERGVVFVGLTGETAENLESIKGFLADTEVTWPNGYGARETAMALGAEVIPMMWVIGPDGRVSWNIDSSESLDAGIERALAKVPASSSG